MLALAYDESDYFLFPPDSSLKDKIISSYKPLIQRHEAVVTSFQKAVADSESESKMLSALKGRKYLYQLFEGQASFVDFESGKSGQRIELVSPEAESNANGLLMEFHDATGSCFKANSTSCQSRK